MARFAHTLLSQLATPIRAHYNLSGGSATNRPTLIETLDWPLATRFSVGSAALDPIRTELETMRENVIWDEESHGLAPWKVRLMATVWYPAAPGANATGLSGGSLRSSRVASNVSLHGASPWHHWSSVKGDGVAAGVSLHGTRPWHQFLHPLT